MKRLIVNADDFGIASPVNRGIIRAHREGVVTSASLMAAGEAAEEAAALARENPGLSVGVHLCLTLERPALPSEMLPTMTRKGRLLGGPLPFMSRLLFGAIDKREILAELRAQIELAISLGIRPTHLDGHQQLHVMPGVFPIVAEIANEFDIPSVRFPVGPWAGRFGVASSLEKAILETLAGSQRACLRQAGLIHPDFFFGLAETGRLETDALKTLISALPDGTSEIMCHPGLRDHDTATRLGCGLGWEKELSAVTDPGVISLIREKAVELVSYKSLN